MSSEKLSTFLSGFVSCSFAFCGTAIPSFRCDFYTSVILIWPARPFAYTADDAVSDYHVALRRGRIFAPAVGFDFVCFFDGFFQILGSTPTLVMYAARRIVKGFVSLFNQVAGKTVIITAVVQIGGVYAAVSPRSCHRRKVNALIDD